MDHPQWSRNALLLGYPKKIIVFFLSSSSAPTSCRDPEWSTVLHLDSWGIPWVDGTQSREHLALLAMQALVKKKQSLRMARQTYYCRYLAKDGFFADSTQNSSTDFDPPWNFLENRNHSSQTEELLRPWLVVFQCVFKKPPRDSCEIYSGHYSSL